MEANLVILSGASGMLGAAVHRALKAREIGTLQLVRRAPEDDRQLRWNPESDHAVEAPERLEGALAAIHLSGASVAARRWTADYRRELTASRVESTRRLARALVNLRRPPKTLLVASATGFYGNRGDEVLNEGSTGGTGFLAGLCREWEAAAGLAVEAGIRVVHLRFGVVLGAGEGALKQMLPPFRAGLGARIGNGRQWISWVGLDDAVAAVLFAMQQTAISGPVNVTAPNPVTNAEFTHALGRQLGKPAILAIPAFAMRLMFGQMADEALLASARVMPGKLQAAGFQFSAPKIEQVLARALG